jgi:sec-independent protein translocase protein TatA
MPMGGLELLILLIIILLFFGAKRVPELARSLGSGARELKKAASEDDDENQTKEPNKVEAREDKEESPPPEKAHREDGRASEGEKPKAGPSAKA